jgi:hypothetical protein
MNKEEAARVLSVMRDTLKKVYLVAIDEERVSALESAVGYLLAEGNNVPIKQPDPITGLVPCGCGGRAKQEDFFDGFFYFGAIKCPGCEIEIRIPSLTPEESSDRVKVAWNRAMSGGACSHEN